MHTRPEKAMVPITYGYWEAIRLSSTRQMHAWSKSGFYVFEEVHSIAHYDAMGILERTIKKQFSNDKFRFDVHYELEIYESCLNMKLIKMDIGITVKLETALNFPWNKIVKLLCWQNLFLDIPRFCLFCNNGRPVTVIITLLLSLAFLLLYFPSFGESRNFFLVSPLFSE